MEQWIEVEKGLIPFGDYLVDCYMDESNHFHASYIGPHNFKIIVKDTISFRMMDASLELRDPYFEQGQATNRPLYLTNYIYEVKNGEFGDLIHDTLSKDIDYHHYKLMSMNYFIDIISKSNIEIYPIT